jgi:hypothetical protein
MEDAFNAEKPNMQPVDVLPYVLIEDPLFAIMPYEQLLMDNVPRFPLVLLSQ